MGKRGILSPKIQKRGYVIEGMRIKFELGELANNASLC